MAYQGQKEETMFRNARQRRISATVVFMALGILLGLFGCQARETEFPATVKPVDVEPAKRKAVRVPEKAPVPIAVLRLQDVRYNRGVLTVVYEDGHVIYRKKLGTPLYHRMLTEKEMGLLKTRMRLLAEQPSGRAAGFIQTYRAVDITTFHVRVDGELHTTEVFDTLAEKSAAKALYDFLVKFKDEKNEAWTPQFVEIRLKAGEPKAATVAWPKDWPGLEAMHEVESGGYLLRLPIDRLPEVRSFFKAKDFDGTVQLDGKEWDVDFFVTLPNASVWQELSLISDIIQF